MVNEAELNLQKISLNMCTKVSVVIPVYNVEKYIERCARSLFEQTLDSIEYIFVDDCSPDNSIAVMENVLAEYPHRKEQIKIIRHEVNQGPYAARRHALQAATGDYVISCDADDWVDYDLYEKMEKDVLAELGMLILKYQESDSEDFASGMVDYIADNPEIFKMIFSAHNTGVMRNKFEKMIEACA